jgi:5-methylcytosine-specific restriction endonuclease McrA
MPHKCTICNVMFSKKANYDRHLSSQKHQTRESSCHTMFQCIKCFRYFTTKSNCEAHKKNCHPQNSSITADEQTQENCNTKVSVSHQLKCQKKEIRTLNEKIKILQSQQSQTEIENLKAKIKALQSPQINILPLRTNISPKIRIQIREKQNNACGICKKDISQVFQLDHSIAIQFGGTNHEDNLMALCCECHAKKSKYEMNYRTEIKAAIFGILQKYMPSLQPAQDAEQNPESGFSEDS